MLNPCLQIWDCIVPGKEGTDWEGGHYPVTMYFSEDYPTNPPVCKLPAGLLHPNVFPDGKVRTLAALVLVNCE